MPGKEKKTRETPKITPYGGKEEDKIIPFEGKARQKEEKKEKEKKVQRIIPVQGKTRKEEEKEIKPFPVEGKGKKEEDKEEKQRKKVQRIIPFEGKAKEKKETLATLFGERMLRSMPSDEVGIAPADPPVGLPTGRPRHHSPLPRVSATVPQRCFSTPPSLPP